MIAYTGNILRLIEHVVETDLIFCLSGHTFHISLEETALIDAIRFHDYSHVSEYPKGHEDMKLTNYPGHEISYHCINFSLPGIQ